MDPAPSPSAYVPLGQVREFLPRSPASLINDVRLGRIPGLRFGGRWYVSRAWLEGLPTTLAEAVNELR